MLKRFVLAGLVFLLSACTPVQTAYWMGLHNLPLPAEVPAVPAPDGWIDLGHGIWGPAILTEIRRCESRGDYTAQNASSSASGAYQFLRSSWAWYGHEARYGAYRASDALPWQQDEAAVFTWQRDGTRPWNASATCWN